MRAATTSDARAHALRRLAACAQDRMAWDEARRCAAEAIALFDAEEDRYFGAMASFDLGITEFLGGRPQEARRLYREVERTLEQLGARRMLGAVRGNLGNVLVAEDRLEEAAACHAGAVRELRGLGSDLVQWQFNLGGTLVSLGRLEEAREVLGEARAQAPALYAIARASGAAQWARLLLAEGHTSEALAIFQDADQRLEAAGDALWRISAVCGIAACYEAQGQLDEAAQAWRKAEDLAVGGGVWEMPMVQRVFVWSRATCQETLEPR